MILVHNLERRVDDRRRDRSSHAPPEHEIVLVIRNVPRASIIDANARVFHALIFLACICRDCLDNGRRGILDGSRESHGAGAMAAIGMVTPNICQEPSSFSDILDIRWIGGTLSPNF